MHNEELHNLYFSPHIIRIKEDQMGTACSTHGVEEECKEDMDVGGIIILK
jgi:hypothetical protein